jgi:hypothetical protein
MSPEEALQEEMQLKSGTLRLGLMNGVKSIARNLRTEDRAVEQDLDIHQRGLFGNSLEHKGSTDDMEIMAARDVHVYDQSKRQSKKGSWIWPALVAALLSAGLLGGGYYAGQILNPDIDTDTAKTIRFKE